jgi:hypothetical protein
MPSFCLSVCLSVRMYSSLEPERLDGFYSYSEFESLSIICRCQVNMNILAPKMGALILPPPQMVNFETGSHDCDEI